MHRRTLLALGAALPALSLSKRLLCDELVPLRKGGVLRVGTSDDYGPFVSATAAGRTGLDVDLVGVLARELGVRVEFVPFKWLELSSRLEQKRFDLAASGVTMRADRLFFGDFSRPYASTGAVACVRTADATRFKSAADLDRPAVRLAVNRGGHLALVARAAFPQARLELLEDNRTLFDRVTSGAVDAVISDSAEARAAARPGLSTLGPFTHDHKAFFVRRNAPALSRYLDDFVFRREMDATLPRLRRKWLGAESRAFDPHLEAVLADIQLRFDLMPWVGAAKRVLHKPVEDRGQEEHVLERVRRSAQASLLAPSSVEALYRVLIRAAKIIQLAPVLPASPTATLDALRDAIGRVDEHLIRCLKSSAPRVRGTAWQKGLDTSVRAEWLPEQVLHELGSALSAVHRVQGKTG